MIDDATPEPALLTAIRAEKQKWNLLAAEALDNSFGANATAVDIVLDQDGFVVRDNGHGIRKGCEPALYKLGKHVAPILVPNALGQYGVGIKWQAVNAGDSLAFSSVSDDGEVNGHADWEKMIATNSWKHVSVDWRAPRLRQPNGTIIRIAKLRVKKPTPADLRKMFSEVRQRYRPAIAMGHRITINGEPVGLLADPPVTEVINDRIDFGAGKAAAISGGLLVDPATSPLWGVHVSKGFKVIVDEKGSFGIGGYTAAHTRIFARVELVGEWKLSRFKETIEDDPDASQLEAEIERILLPILVKAASASFDVRTDELETAINANIPPQMAAARPEREKKPTPTIVDTDSSSSKPKRPPGITKKPTSDKTGPARTPQDHRLLKISFEDGLFAKDAEGTIGRFVRSKGRAPHIVQYAKDCPAIWSYMHLAKNGGAKPLADLALSWFVYAGDNLDADFFGRRMWKLMRDQAAVAQIPDMDVA